MLTRLHHLLATHKLRQSSIETLEYNMRRTQACVVYILTNNMRRTQACVVYILTYNTRRTQACVVYILTYNMRRTQACVLYILTYNTRRTQACVLYIQTSSTSALEEEEYWVTSIIMVTEKQHYIHVPWQTKLAPNLYCVLIIARTS